MLENIVEAVHCIDPLSFIIIDMLNFRNWNENVSKYKCFKNTKLEKLKN